MQLCLKKFVFLNFIGIFIITFYVFFTKNGSYKLWIKGQNISAQNEIESKLERNKKIEQKSKIYYNKNYIWTINSNIAQYSSYIIIEDNKYRIESIIISNYQRIKSLEKKNIYAFIKSINKNSIKVLRLNDMYDLPESSCKKLVINLKFSINVTDIAIAFIYKNDFTREFKRNFKRANSSLSYKMINYQIPSILNAKKPRLKSVSSCVQHTYLLPPGLQYWLDMQKQFGIQKIGLYDATEDYSLTKFVNSKQYGEFLRLKPYYITSKNLCKYSLTHENITNALEIEHANYLCYRFYSKELAPFMNGKHEHITSNDCFIEMSQTYEFITLYDVDEMIFPRSLNLMKLNQQQNNFKCNETTYICSYKPFMNNSMYDYLIGLVENYFTDDINKLASIYFKHAVYIQHADQIRLLNSVKSILEKIKFQNKATKYPIYLLLGEDIQNNHKLIIDESDIEYIKYLSHIATTLDCLYQTYIKNINIEKSLLKYMFLITSEDQRIGKSLING